MCGIAGYIGQSKKPKVSYDLITALFDFLEIRGTDASGLWGTETGKDGRVVYHKEPLRSSEFIKGDFWKKTRKIKMDVLLVHARAASKGAGHAATNANNHPFVSKDKRIGMVHNGHLDEADFLKNKYQTISDTDSEYLLRMYEHGLDQDYDVIDGVPDEVSNRMTGIKDIWSVVNVGAMAVALGERVSDDERVLFLFRNEKRPLWVADLRAPLGQVFFFSSPDIWYRAVASNNTLKDICWGTQKLIELPTSEAWFFRITKDQPIITEKNFFRLNIDVGNTVKEWEHGSFCKLKKSQVELSVVSKLDDDEEIVTHKKPKVVYDAPHKRSFRNDRDELMEPSEWDDPFVSDDHDAVCENIKNIVDRINTNAHNLMIEGSMQPHDYDELLQSLKQTQHELEGTLRLMRQ